MKRLKFLVLGLLLAGSVIGSFAFTSKQVAKPIFTDCCFFFNGSGDDYDDEGAWVDPSFWDEGNCNTTCTTPTEVMCKITIIDCDETYVNAGPPKTLKIEENQDLLDDILLAGRTQSNVTNTGNYIIELKVDPR